MTPVEQHIRGRIRALSNHLKAVPVTSWCAEMSTDGGLTWGTNALRFATKEEAQDYGYDLMQRWTAVTGFVASPRSDPVNRVWEDGKIGYLSDLGHTS